MFVEIVPIFVTRQKGKHEPIRIHPLPCNASVPSLIHRNSNFAFPGTVLPKSTSALQGTEPNQMVNRSGVSFPVMAPFSQPQSSYILNQDIAPLQGIAPPDAGVQVYSSVIPNKQANTNYLQRRQPQKPCKRPRRYACQFTGCDRSFDSQWALERYRRVRLLMP